MTVKELIAELRKMDQRKSVYFGMVEKSRL